MIEENSSDPIPSLRGIDALKVKTTVSEINDIICNIRLKNLDELKNLLGAGARSVCNKVGVIANKNKNIKNLSGQNKLKVILQESEKV